MGRAECRRRGGQRGCRVHLSPSAPPGQECPGGIGEEEEEQEEEAGGGTMPPERGASQNRPIFILKPHSKKKNLSTSYTYSSEILKNMPLSGVYSILFGISKCIW